MKTCTRCKEEQPTSGFGIKERAKDGFNWWCKKCEKEYRDQYTIDNPDYFKNRHLKQRYGISLEDKAQMLLMQGGKCAICGTNKPGGNGAWHTDHNHETRDIRGLLCHICNITVGNIENGWDVEVPSITRYLDLYS